MNPTPQQGRKQRIIIIEDNALVAKFFQMALERAGGFSCLVTEDVPTILREVTAGEVDLARGKAVLDERRDGSLRALTGRHPGRPEVKPARHSGGA